MSESTRKLSIFEIGDELNGVIAAIEKAEDDGAEAVVLDALNQFFEQSMTDRDKKLDNYANLIAYTEVLAGASEDEVKRLSALSKTRRALADSLKNRLKVFLELNGVTSLSTANHKFTVVKNPRASLVISSGTTPELIDERFRALVPTIDKEKIRVAIESGEEIEFARLESGTHLRIK